jgi:hypothetical protein
MKVILCRIQEQWMQKRTQGRSKYCWSSRQQSSRMSTDREWTLFEQHKTWSIDPTHMEVKNSNVKSYHAKHILYIITRIISLRQNYKEKVSMACLRKNQSSRMDMKHVYHLQIYSKVCNIKWSLRVLARQKKIKQGYKEETIPINNNQHVQTRRFHICILSRMD